MQGYGSTEVAKRPVLPARRLSISSNSQWIAPSGHTPSPSSGYALSPSSATHPTLPRSDAGQPPSTPSSGIHRSPSFGRTIRQLDPVSIFERLGLGGDAPSTQLTSQGGIGSQAGPSPGREDAHLPSEEFEGIPVPDTSDMVTPVPSSFTSEVEANSGASRRTLSNGAAMMEDPSPSLTGLAILQAQSNGNNEDNGTISSSSSTPRTPSQTLMEIASAPPVDLVDPSLHPPHALVLQYSQQAAGEDSNGNKKIIPVNEDILLPFVNRPTEVGELLELEPRNRSLFERLKEVFEPHPFSSSFSSSSSLSSSSSSTTPTPHLSTSTTSTASSTDNHHKQTWQEVEAILYKPREELKDQEWIDSLKSAIFPRSTALWERLRACIGIDVDDEQGGDRYEELSSDFNAVIFSPSSADQQQQRQQYGISVPSSPLLGEDMLSPRAILRTQGGGVNIPGFSPSRLNAYSPAGSAGVSPSPSPGPGNTSGSSIGAARQFDRTTNSGADSSASNKSPGKSGHASLITTNNAGDSSSTRMHRRTSSGGSSFRRSFAMSSISEDAPVVDFGNQSGPTTPSLETTPSYGNTPSSFPAGGMSEDNGMSTMTNAINIAGMSNNAPDLHQTQGVYQHHPHLQGSALSTSASSSVLSGHSMTHGQANLLSPSASSSSNNISSLGLNVDVSPTQNSSQIPRSPSFSNSARLNIMGSSGNNNLGNSWGNFQPQSSTSSISSSPSFNTLYNKRAYDEYNSVFESDDGESVSGSVRSTGKGPGMRRSFGQMDALSPIRGSTPRQSGAGPVGGRGGGFALAGLTIGGNKTSSSQNSSRNTTPKP